MNGNWELPLGAGRPCRITSLLPYFLRGAAMHRPGQHKAQPPDDLSLILRFGRGPMLPCRLPVRLKRRVVEEHRPKLDTALGDARPDADRLDPVPCAR